MRDEEKKILAEYSLGYEVATASYEAMGRMLDENYVKERLKKFNIKSMYIYGGTYMAVQLYRIGREYVDVRGVVDKYGKVLDDNISVMMLDEFYKNYDGEKIIITPMLFFEEICRDLASVTNRKNMIGIGELLLGLN